VSRLFFEKVTVLSPGWKAPVANSAAPLYSFTTPISLEAPPGALIPKVKDPKVTAAEPVLFKLNSTAVTPAAPGISTGTAACPGSPKATVSGVDVAVKVTVGVVVNVTVGV
jgi:hypothetical protein